MSVWKFSYSKRWYVTHPWVWVEDVIRNLKWAAQRVFRGYDDTVVWSIDWHLCEYMPKWLCTLKENKQGYPADFYENGGEEAWNKVLDDMIAGFEAGFKILNEPPIDKDEYQALTDRWSSGMELFKEYFFALWD